MRAREALCRSELFGDDLQKLFPLIREGQSDTATFDNVLEFLVQTGRPLAHAILMMIPEPWRNHESMRADRKAFYRYHASLMEPWDGPASIAFTDGTVIGAVLDRNGLRPSRYYVTKDDMVIMASEVGVLDIRPENVVVKERLHPGRIFLVDTAQGRIIDDAEIKNELAAEHPYAAWLEKELVHIDNLPPAPYAPPTSRETVRTTAARVRIHGRGSAGPHRANGANRRRADRLDGHRHRAGRALGPGASAVRLLQAAVRASDEPAARRDSRRSCDRHGSQRSGRSATCSRRKRPRVITSRSTPP